MTTLVGPPGVAPLLPAALGAGPLDAGAVCAAEWHALADAAARHGVLPLAWHRLQERGVAELLPAEVRATMEASQLLAGLRAEARRRQLAEIVEVLGAHGLPVVLLKGADVAVRLYPSPAVRSMADLDLLVPAGTARRAAEALAGVGYPAPDHAEWEAYRAHRHPPPIHRAGRLTVELHEVIDPWAPPFGETMDALWARVQPAGAAQPGAHVLAAEDLLLHLATHMGRNHLLGSSLARVCDVAWWMARLGAAADWDALVQRSRTGGSRRFVATALRLAQRLLAATVPPDVTRALQGPGDDAVVADALALLDATSTEIAGAMTLTQGDRPLWRRLGRLARTLGVLSPARRATAGADTTPRRARWGQLARTLLDAEARRLAMGRLAQVRRLRGWATGGG